MTADLRERLCRWGRSLFERGLTGGSSGNITVRHRDGLPRRPRRTPASASSTRPPSPSSTPPGATSAARSRPRKCRCTWPSTTPGRGPGAVVHLHSTYATLLSCLADTDPDDAVPAVTPYVVMRVGRVPLLPYYRPGDAADRAPDPRQGRDARPRSCSATTARSSPAPTLEAAVFASEELEETAKLAILGRGHPLRLLDPAEIARLAPRG